MNAVGQAALKVDAYGKLTGRTLYAGDLRFPGALWLKVYRSPVTRGTIDKIDISEAVGMPGVVGVFTAEDVPGVNEAGARVKDEKLFCEKEVRAKGDPIALVAAETEGQAEEAIKRIKVSFTPLPAVYTISEAMKDDAPVIHEKGNRFLVRRVRRGVPEEALQEADVTLSRTFKTQWIEHAYLEPEAGAARYEGGLLTVYLPSKYLAADLKELCSVLDLSPNDLRLVLAAVGGYFGGKSGIGPAFYCALATLLTGRPTRMVYNREESFQTTTKRHGMEIEHTLGAKKDGTITAVRSIIHGDTGAYTSFGPSVLTRAAVHAAGPYEVPNCLIESYGVFTNNPPAGAMRGFGAPQVAFSYESMMDILAQELKMDPVELRCKNYLHESSITATGQQISESVGLDETCRLVSDYIEKQGTGWRYEDEAGVYAWGLASMHYGIGSTALPNPADISLSCGPDGRIEVSTTITDGGQGAATAMCQIAAESVGVSLDRVAFADISTDFPLDSGTSTASRLTYVVGRAVFEAGRILRKQLMDYAAEILKCSPKDLKFEGDVFVGPARSITLEEVAGGAARTGISLQAVGHFDPDTTKLDPETGQGKPYGTYAFATQAVLIKVDRETSQVDVIKVVAAHDVGRAINPNMVTAQIEGAVVMGMGYSLMEEVVIREGQIINPNFKDYLLPTVKDIPEIVSFIVEEPEPTGPYGAKGVGEPAMVPTAAAVANAVYKATGSRIYELPITADRVWRSLSNTESRMK